jgi:leucyl/phenylalanyl-tRNA--protein transferase
VTYDRAFEAVLYGCAEAPRREGQTWISPEFIAAYIQLHLAGHAHSVEVWQEGKLAGGIYGVAVGGLFAGESMFHRVTDASKVALVHCARRLQERQYTLFDTQMVTPVTSSLGAFEIPRAEYLTRLASAVFRPCEFA